MKRDPHLLLVSWWFPPLTEGGVYRPLNFVRHLTEHGVRITVLTGQPAADARQDDSLMRRVPDSVRIVRCGHVDPFRVYARLKHWLRPGAADPASGKPGGSSGAAPDAVDGERPETWKDLLSESCALPDRWRSWVAPATLRAAQALRGDEPDLIFSTSPPHSMHLVASELRARYGCPWVVDFRDPWVGNPFREFRARRLHRLDQAMERRVVDEATAIVANTAALERRLRERYPGLDKVRTIPNGYSVDHVNTDSPAAHDPPFELLHVGHLYGARSGRYLLEGLALLKQQEPAQAAKLRVELVGHISDQPAFAARAQEAGLGETLRLTDSLPHAEALRRQRQADGLLILGVEQPGPEVQVPGKIYEYFAARRPVVSLSRAGGAIQETLEQARFPHVIAEPDDPAGIARALSAFVTGKQGGALDRFVDTGVEAFGYDRLTRRLMECFSDCLGEAWPAGTATAPRGR